jgi:hypothetical protein
VYYHPQFNVQPIVGVAGGTTPESPVDISAVVPTDRCAGCSYRLFVDVRPLVNLVVVGHVSIRAYQGVDTTVYWIEHGISNGQPMRGGSSADLIMPMVYSNFWYQITATTGEVDIAIDVMSYQVPNGDS